MTVRLVQHSVEYRRSRNPGNQMPGPRQLGDRGARTEDRHGERRWLSRPPAPHCKQANVFRLTRRATPT